MNEQADVQPLQVLLPGRRSLLVRLNARAGMRAALLDLLNRYADELAEEPGTEMFVVSIDPENANTVWLYEVFKNEDAQLAHRAAPGFATLTGSMPDLLDGPPAILPMEPLRMVMQENVLRDDWSI